MRRQLGVTLIGFIVLIALIGALAIIAFRTIPIYSEYFTVRKIIKAINVEAGEVTPNDVRNQFILKASADYVTDIKAKDLDITRENGKVVISLNYSKTVPLFANVSLLFDFETSNRK